ncbi:MAG: sensor domain-containing diguanylate cyclase [Pseudomonadota bacterium]
MKPTTFPQRLAVVLVLSLGAAFFYATYKAIDNIVAEQSRVQQQAVSPVFKLVRDELLRPLYIAETFASSVDFTAMMDSPDFDEDALLDRLQSMEQDLELVFFVASEKTRKQYFSNGRTLDLVEGEVAWYFEAIERDKDFMADLGQVGDVHLYFDVKIYGPEREFLGYVGVGKRVQRFLDTFDQYKARYGYDFLFVNDDNEIILTSLPDLVVRDAYIPTLDSLDWFDHGDGQAQSHDSEIIEVDDGDYLISEFGIEELGWRLLLLAPLEARQNQIVRAFLTNALVAAFSVTLLASAGLFLVLLYKRRLENRTELDPLTGLPNRAHVQRRFQQLQRAGVELCAVIIDLDHFKQVNDQHGHETGDRVLRAAADALKQELRDKDIVSRWGGEEFVMLIPAADIELGQTIAERARQNIESLRIDTKEGCVSVTASFGVAFGSARHEQLEALVAKADEVLYQAKEKGRNQVELYEAS